MSEVLLCKSIHLSAALGVGGFGSFQEGGHNTYEQLTNCGN